MSLYNYNIEYDIFNNFNREKIFEYNIMPLYYEELFLVVATSDSSLKQEELSLLFNHPVKIVLVPHVELQFEWRYYSIKNKLYFLAKNMSSKFNKKENSKEIVAFIDNLFSFCIENRVSDIHLEAVQSAFLIRLRIDGSLHQFFRFDIQILSIVSSYIKYLANLDISQKRHPLNSRFSKYIKNKTFDIRVSTLPTIFGESIVLRILNNQDTQKRLKDIGFSKNTLEVLNKVLGLKQGLFLVTGPTGSGKTTTLYSMIQELHTLEKKIITIEDPVEYKIQGVMQVNINEDIDLSYQVVLKNILRQDPDILLIGEIRDKESLKIAIQASLTGHLVFATLHTNNSLETIHRLLDLGAEPYLIAATLKGVISQRLVRILCNKCKEKVDAYHIQKGCKSCNYSGYNGRQVVCEILQIDDRLKSFIINKQKDTELKEYLKNINFISLKENCKKLIFDGLTSKEECLNKI